MNWFHDDPHSDPFVHPDAPAGGPGWGYFRTPGPLLDPPSCSSVPHKDSPAGRHFDWHTELPRIAAALRAEAVYEALQGAVRLVPAEVRHATGQELGEIARGLVPGLLMFIGVLVASALLGAAAGAAIGALFAGVGAVPGAAIGADLGLGVGTALLEYLGLAFLAGYIGKSLWQAGRIAGDAVERAWHSPERRHWASSEVDHASRQLAKAVALVFRGVLQGVVAFVLAKGSAAAATRVPELVAKLRGSKLGIGFAEWVEKNWARLIEEPRLKDGPPPAQPPVSARDSGPAMTPSQLRKALESEQSVVREGSVRERVQGGDAANGRQLFRNLAPEDEIAPAVLFPASQIQKVGYSGRLTYVVTPSGELVIGRTGHISLSRGADVLAAGEARFVNGSLRTIDNASGHYQPSGASAQSAAEAAFRGAGFDGFRYIERTFP